MLLLFLLEPFPMSNHPRASVPFLTFRSRRIELNQDRDCQVHIPSKSYQFESNSSGSTLVYEFMYVSHETNTFSFFNLLKYLWRLTHCCFHELFRGFLQFKSTLLDLNSSFLQKKVLKLK